MKVDTKAAREFSEGCDRYTGAEVRLWVHNLADEVDRLRAALAALCEPLLKNQEASSTAKAHAIYEKWTGKHS